MCNQMAKLIYLFRADYSADSTPIEGRNFPKLSTTRIHILENLNILVARFRWRKRSPDPLEKALIKDQTSLDESEDEKEGRENILDLILSEMFVRFPGEREERRGER